MQDVASELANEIQVRPVSIHLDLVCTCFRANVDHHHLGKIHLHLVKVHQVDHDSMMVILASKEMHTV